MHESCALYPQRKLQTLRPFLSTQDREGQRKRKYFVSHGGFTFAATRKNCTPLHDPPSFVCLFVATHFASTAPASFTGASSASFTGASSLIFLACDLCRARTSWSGIRWPPPLLTPYRSCDGKHGYCVVFQPVLVRYLRSLRSHCFFGVTYNMRPSRELYELSDWQLHTREW